MTTDHAQPTTDIDALQQLPEEESSPDGSIDEPTCLTTGVQDPGTDPLVPDPTAQTDDPEAEPADDAPAQPADAPPAEPADDAGSGTAT